MNKVVTEVDYAYGAAIKHAYEIFKERGLEGKKTVQEVCDLADEIMKGNE